MKKKGCRSDASGKGKPLFYRGIRSDGTYAHIWQYLRDLPVVGEYLESQRWDSRMQIRDCDFHTGKFRARSAQPTGVETGLSMGGA